MIPGFVDIGGPLKVLPSGVHTATIAEVETRFAVSEPRKHLFSGLKLGLAALRRAGCRVIYLDGSFVTEKNIPNDYDLCWETNGVIVDKLDPVFLDFSYKRQKQKEKYYGEYFPANFIADGTLSFYNFFQTDKYTGKPKGIIRICLS